MMLSKVIKNCMTIYIWQTVATSACFGASWNTGVPFTTTTGVEFHRHRTRVFAEKEPRELVDLYGAFFAAKTSRRFCGCLDVHDVWCLPEAWKLENSNLFSNKKEFKWMIASIWIRNSAEVRDFAGKVFLLMFFWVWSTSSSRLPFVVDWLTTCRGCFKLADCWASNSINF